MKKEDFKLKQSTKDMFTGTQVGALLEDVDHKLEFIGEKVLSIEGKMDTMEGRMDRMEVKIDAMETKLDATFEAVGDIKIELTGLRKKDEDLDRRVVVLEKRAVI